MSSLYDGVEQSPKKGGLSRLDLLNFVWTLSRCDVSRFAIVVLICCQIKGRLLSFLYDRDWLVGLHFRFLDGGCGCDSLFFLSFAGL